MTQEENIHGIQRTCYSKNRKAGEQFIKEHGVSFVCSGEMEAYDGRNRKVYRKGDIVLYRKNSLTRFVKYTGNDEAFEAMAVVLDDVVLKEFVHRHQVAVLPPVKETLFLLDQDDVLTGYFNSLMSWFGNTISPELAAVKKTELVHLLLRNNKKLAAVLFNFEMPGKINLEAFMNINFKFNVPLAQLAFLTGRSLAGFKRDFEKLFQLSPNRWLQQKRLEEAYYLLFTKQMKPKDVYLEVGFETLAHFSYAFKNKFGINPSALKQ